MGECSILLSIHVCILPHSVHTHTHTHARTHAHTHTRTLTHTHSHSLTLTLTHTHTLTLTLTLTHTVITNIASLVLGYDMRRLNDITAFRRYWYRTSLVEALFIGSKKKPSGSTPVGGQTSGDSNPASSAEDSLKGTQEDW